ncbi:MAG: knotted carbamoyltransferase YgeW [Candidatus Cloacimonadota bacterium]|nr:MAG: knotted carbamoyltransferase YgeW [Candidatus Cloacimonadota bacterium]
MEILLEKLKRLEKLNLQMFGKDFLLTWEKSIDDLKATLLVTEILKEMHKNNYSLKIFESGLGISIFRDQSTRTRFSFASACNFLGLSVQDFDEKKSQIAHGETVRETANMISFLAEVIGIRDDIFIGEGDKYQRNVAQAVQFGFENKILHQRPTVINLQSDIDHPTQSMSDLAKIADHFGGLSNLQGKKIVMSWAYSPSYGKPLSVAQGMIGLLSRFGAEVVLAHPDGYELLPEVIELAKNQAKESGGSFQITNDMKEAFTDADVVCPKSWASFKVMEQRRDLLHKNDEKGLNELEQICLQENAQHLDWECTEEMMNLTNNALYMHPLPADISGVNCDRGEVSQTVFDKNILHTYSQASFKPFVIAAMIFLSKIDNPVAKLEELLRNKIYRKK